MIHILYTTAIVSATLLTFFLTRRQYRQEPLQPQSEPTRSPLPAQTDTSPISVRSDEFALETHQEGVNKVIDLLREQNKVRDGKTKPKSWLGMNE